MSKKNINLYDAFKIEKDALTFVGFYPQRIPKCRFLYLLSGFFTITICCYEFLSMFVQLIIDIADLSKVSEIVFYFITHNTYMCKMVNFMIYRNSLFDIEDTLAKPSFNTFPESRLKILKEKIKSAQNVALSFRVMCFMAVIFMCSMPYLDKNKKSLPINGWHPYDAENFYYPTAVIQIISICLTAANNVNFDGLTWILIAVASAQFDILKKNLESLDYSRKTEDMEDEFKKCVKHHEETVAFVHTIESVFSKGIFMTFLSSVVVICFTGFMMIIVPFMSFQFNFLALYLLCMMTQVAVYCWFGHDVMVTSDEIGLSFHMSNWYESSLSLRQGFTIFLERTKKPMTLTAGKLVVLNLATFTSILRSSYSYFAVLQQLYSDS